MQEQKEEDRVAVKSKPTAMNLTSTVSTSSSSVNHPIASKSLGILKASTGEPDARARRNSKPDAASSSRGRLKDAYFGGLMFGVAEKLAATKVRSHGKFLSDLNPGAITRKKVSVKLGAESCMPILLQLFCFRARTIERAAQGADARKKNELDGMNNRSYDAQFKELRPSLGPLVRGFIDFENHVKTISIAVGLLTSRITNVEQIVSALPAKMVAFAEMEHNFSAVAARVCKIETGTASASSVSGSARSWSSPGQVDGSTAAGSHCPGPSEEGRNARRRLDSF